MIFVFMLFLVLPALHFSPPHADLIYIKPAQSWQLRPKDQMPALPIIVVQLHEAVLDGHISVEQSRGPEAECEGNFVVREK